MAGPRVLTFSPGRQTQLTRRSLALTPTPRERGVTSCQKDTGD